VAADTEVVAAAAGLVFARLRLRNAIDRADREQLGLNRIARLVAPALSRGTVRAVLAALATERATRDALAGLVEHNQVCVSVHRAQLRVRLADRMLYATPPLPLTERIRLATAVLATLGRAGLHATHSDPIWDGDLRAALANGAELIVRTAASGRPHSPVETESPRR
jgi:hypothetical protein